MSVQPANPPLLNLDILEEVFLYLANDLRSDYESWQPARQTLRDLALLSRQLTQPALRVLWRSMDSLLPLLLLLPQVQKKDGEYVLRGAFSTDSWARFDFYAGKIRRYKYSGREKATQANPMIYACIARARGTFILLPNLQSLFIDLRDDVSVRTLEYLVPVLAGRTLKELEIWNSFLNQDFEEQSEIWNLNSGNLSTSLVALNNFCDIRNVIIHGDAPNDSFQSIASLESLRRLHFSLEWSDPNQPRPSFLKELAQRNQLLDIDMDLGRANYSQLDWCGYAALQRVSLRGDLISLINIVSVMETTTLSELDLHMECRHCSDHRTDNHPGVGSWGVSKNVKLELFVRVLTERWAQSMEILTIHVACTPLASSQSVEDLLIPMAKLIRLRSLEFAIAELDTWNPADQANISPTHINTSKVVQHLSKLTQVKALSLPSACKVSLTDIHYLVFHMPHLRKLRVSFLLDNNIPACGALPPLLHRLTTLVIDQSPFPLSDIVQTNLVCWHLYHMFPELRLLEFDKASGSYFGRASSWCQVMGILTLIRSMKAELLAAGEQKPPLSLPPIWVDPLPAPKHTKKKKGKNSNKDT